MSILIIIAIAIFFFLIGREFFLWYFGINKIVSLLEKIEKNTRLQTDDKISSNQPI